MGDDTSKVRFDECVRTIVDQDGGRVDAVWFEQNGKWAHVHLYWESLEQKAVILLDLEAEDVVDLVTPAEMDDLIAKREAAT